MNLKHNLHHTLFMLVALCAALCLTTNRAFATDHTWNNAAGGNFNTAANWTPASVPTTTDNAIITLAGTYTVTMSTNRTVTSLTLGAASGTQTLNLSGFALTTSADSTVNANGVLTLDRGTLGGAGAQTVASGGILNWNGTISGTAVAQTTTIAAGATVNFNNGTLDKRTLTNNGTFNWTGGDLVGSQGAIINNESGGLVDIAITDSVAAATLIWSGSGGNPVFNNKAGATLRKRNGAHYFQIISSMFTNNGTLDLQEGIVYLSHDNFTNLSSGTLTGGTYLVTGTLTVEGDIVTNAANITLNGATSAIINRSSNTDALTGFNTNAAAGSLTLTGNKTLAIRPAAGHFTNAGTVALGTSSILNVQGAAKNYVQTGGTTDLNGGTLTTTATGKVNINGGSLIGTGTINSTLSNAASVAPGHSPGIITVNTNYTQTGALNMEIGGTNAATPEYDQLKVTGTVTLGGALNLSLINSFVPNGGDSFTLISNGGTDAVVGTFSGLAQGAPVTVGSQTFLINYAGGDGNDVVLKNVPTISINDVSLTEGNSGTTNAVFTVTLSKASAEAVKVDYVTQDGTAKAPGDYTTTSGTLTIPAGQLTGTISVPAIGDTLNETNENFKVHLSNGVNGAIVTADGTGTIVNNDPVPSLSVANISLLEGNGTTNFTFTVALSAVSGLNVKVNYATADGTATAGSDYTLTSGTLTIPAGQASGTITVPVSGDTTVEADETFFVNFSSPVNATLDTTQATGTIANDDFPTISINSPNILEGNLGDVNKPLNFTVTLSQAFTKDVTVKYATADTNAATGKAEAGKDYVATSGTLTIPAGQTSGIITVPIMGDNLNEDNETFFLNLSAPTNATIATGQGVGTIIDNDALPILSSSNIQVTEGTGGTKTADFTMTMNAVSGRNVGFTCNTADGTARTPSDYTATRVNLTIPAGQTTAKFSVPLVTDATDEVDETFFSFLTLPVNAKISTARVQCTILNDDAANAPVISIDSPSVKEGNSGLMNATFHINLSKPSGKVVSVTFTTSDRAAAAGVFPATANVDYQPLTTTVAVSAGQTVAIAHVVIIGDTLDEENETFQAKISNPVNGSITAGADTGICTIIDDDTAPALSITDVKLNEGNSGTTNFTFNVTLTAASAKTITVKYATADGTAKSTSDYTAQSGTLTFAPDTTTLPITVKVKGDTVVEGDETFFVLLSGQTNVSGISKARGTGTITNDDSSG